MPLDKNPISNIAKANKLTKSLFQSIITEEKMIDYCSKVLNHEINELKMDRGIQSIGLAPSNIHNYENFIKYPNLAVDTNESLPYAIAASRAIQLEMVVSLFKPSTLVFYNCSFWSFPVDYLEQLPVENIYVPNDEDLYRAENIYLNREVELNVISSVDLQNANLPQGTDMVCINGVDLASNLDQTLISNIYSALDSGAVIFIDNNNDFLQYYLNGSDTIAENLNNPFYDLNQSIDSLEGCSVYHIPTTAGFSVIIKN